MIDESAGLDAVFADDGVVRAATANMFFGMEKSKLTYDFDPKTFAPLIVNGLQVQSYLRRIPAKKWRTQDIVVRLLINL